MSRKKKISVQCPKCGRTLETEMWESVNVTLDAEFKKQILDGTFGEIVCENCGESAHIMYPFWYHDMKLERMVYVLASQGEDDPEQIEKIEDLPKQLEFDALPDMFGDSNYIFRIVSNINDLKEKIILWDAGLDDRVMEVAKCFTLVAARDEIDAGDVQSGALGLWRCDWEPYDAPSAED